MDKIVRTGIVEIIKKNTALLRIPLRQKAKFEGWLKFELAYYLEQKEMKNVEVKAKRQFNRNRSDISFFHNGEPYNLELKTPNTNWRIQGVNTNCRPITKNIQSVIDDAKKLNSENGIVAFVLFPIPVADPRWEFYLTRINDETNLGPSKQQNCELVDLNFEEHLTCSVVVCTFMSKRFHNWSF